MIVFVRTLASESFCRRMRYRHSLSILLDVRRGTMGRADLRVNSRRAVEESVKPLHMGSNMAALRVLGGKLAASIGMKRLKRAPRIPRSFIVNKDVRRGVIVWVKVGVVILSGVTTL